MCRKKSFILYTDIRNTYAKMTDEEIGRLHRFIADYNYIDIYDKEQMAKFESELDKDRIVSVVFADIRNKFERDEAKYQNIIERRRKAGQKGGYAKAGKTMGEDGSKKESSLPAVASPQMKESDFDKIYSAWANNLLTKKEENDWREIVKKENGIWNLKLAFALFKDFIIKNGNKEKFLNGNQNFNERKKYFVFSLPYFVTDECKKKPKPAVAKVITKNGKKYVQQFDYERELPDNAPKQPDDQHYFDFTGGWNSWRKD